MEPNEIHEFAEQVKEGGEKSLTHVSVIISVLAVLVALVTVLGHRQHTHAVLLQTRAADQWNEYQSRKLRVQQLQVTSDLMSLQSASDPKSVQAKIAGYKTQIAKWQGELDAGAAEARKLEAEVDVAEARAARFDLGEALLQIAVILASITLLTHQQRYVLAAVIVGLVGIGISAAAFLVH